MSETLEGANVFWVSADFRFCEIFDFPVFLISRISVVLHFCIFTVSTISDLPAVVISGNYVFVDFPVFEIRGSAEIRISLF